MRSVSRTALWTFSVLFFRVAGGQETPDLPATPSKTTWCQGYVVDEGGNPVRSAMVMVAETEAHGQRVTTDGNGSFRVLVETEGCHLKVRAPGFAQATIDQETQAQPDFDVGRVMLRLETGATEVVVTATRDELAQEQVQTELGQRILGVIPNFMVTYDPHAVPLNARQKYTLALRTMVDPETIGADLGWTVLEQKTASTKGYGAGANGYARRFVTSYATGSLQTLLGSAVLPSLFQQDPRYFYKGSGSYPRRALYAISMSVLCKNDSGHWQYNYSGLLGGLAAGGLSRLYVPRASQDGLSGLVENTAVGIGTSAVSNLFQEFLIRKFSHR